MIHYRSEITINRPPSEVFAWLAEPVRQGQWMGMSSGANDGPPVLTANAEYMTHVTGGPMAGAYRMRVSAFDQDSQMTIETIDGKVGWRGVFTLEPTPEGGTRLVNEGDFSARGFLRLLEPFLRGEAAKSEQAELEKLKGLIEGA
jgi:uncharacterized protein YndB with AHSA1/START domain